MFISDFGSACMGFGAWILKHVFYLYSSLAISIHHSLAQAAGKPILHTVYTLHCQCQTNAYQVAQILAVPAFHTWFYLRASLTQCPIVHVDYQHG